MLVGLSNIVPHRMAKVSAMKKKSTALSHSRRPTESIATQTHTAVKPISII